MNRIVHLSLAFALLALTRLDAQIVSFESPHPWMSSRSDTVTVKVFFDTIQVMHKTLRVSFEKSLGGRRTSLGSRSLKVSANSHAFFMNDVKERVFGGRDFISMKWELIGTKESGEIGPIGIADVRDFDNVMKFPARKIVAPDPVSAIKDGAPAQAAVFTLDGRRIRLAYTLQELFIEIEGRSAAPDLVFAFDGKNAKRAYIAYADRFLRCSPASATLQGWRFEREYNQKKGITYTEKKWYLEGTVHQQGERYLASVPWHHIAMLPQRRTMAGFAVFVDVPSGATLPPGADRLIPVTWGNIVFMGELTPEENQKMFGTK